MKSHVCSKYLQSLTKLTLLTPRNFKRQPVQGLNVIEHPQFSGLDLNSPNFHTANTTVKVGKVIHTCNTELNDLRKNICLRKSEVTIERISVCNLLL